MHFRACILVYYNIEASVRDRSIEGYISNQKLINPKNGPN